MDAFPSNKIPAEQPSDDDLVLQLEANAAALESLQAPAIAMLGRMSLELSEQETDVVVRLQAALRKISSTNDDIFNASLLVGRGQKVDEPIIGSFETDNVSDASEQMPTFVPFNAEQLHKIWNIPRKKDGMIHMKQIVAALFADTELSNEAFRMVRKQVLSTIGIKAADNGHYKLTQPEPPEALGVEEAEPVPVEQAIMLPTAPALPTSLPEEAQLVPTPPVLPIAFSRDDPLGRRIGEALGSTAPRRNSHRP